MHSQKESSSGKAVVPENDVPTMESLPVTLEVLTFNYLTNTASLGDVYCNTEERS